MRIRWVILGDLLHRDQPSRYEQRQLLLAVANQFQAGMLRNLFVRMSAHSFFPTPTTCLVWATGKQFAFRLAASAPRCPTGR